MTTSIGNPILLSPFLPSNFPNLNFWLDSSNPNGDGTQYADNTALSSIKDLSPNKFPITQGTGANQPTYKLNILNGLPVIRFNGTSSTMNTSSTSVLNASPFTFFAIARTTNAASGARLLTKRSQGWGFGRTTTGQAIFTTYAISDYITADTSFYPVNTWVNRYDLINTAAGTDSFYKSNVLNETVTKTAGLSSPGTVPIYLGSSLGTSGFWEGDIAEIILYSRALSSGEIAKVYTYLKMKWGVA